MGGREAGGDKIQWTRLDQPWFDRIVETLLLRKFRGIADVDVVDGRGGDDGVDVGVTFPDGSLTIYQLKYYPEGMSGGFAKRRDNVKNSYVKAVTKNKPNQWILVAPRNYTNSEKRFIRGLASKATPAATRRPTVGWLGQAELDQLLIDYPEVDRWLTLDHYRETRRIFEYERMAFLESGAADLARRVGALGELVDSRDADWTWDFARSDGAVVQTLRALNDNAAQRSPIKINFDADLDPESAVGIEFRRSMQYGSPSQVEIPGSSITKFEVLGPEIVQGIPDPETLIMRSLPVEGSPAVGMLMEARLSHEDKLVLKQEGVVTEVRNGTHGLTCVMSYVGGRVTLAAEIPFKNGPDTRTMMDVGYDLEGLSPRSVAELLRFVLGLQLAHEVAFYIDGQFLTRYRGSGVPSDDDDDFREQQMLYSFAEDLAGLLAHTGQNMTFPRTFDQKDRVHARVARLLIEGHVVASPLARGVRARLVPNAEYTEEIAAILTERQNRQWLAGAYTALIGDRTFELGSSVVVHPETWVENGPAALATFERGRSDGIDLVLRPGDDPYFFVFLVESAPSKEAERWFAKWDLDGIDEPWLDRTCLTPVDET
ncbi:hypothetical protein SAMN05444374_11847 [Rhodococcoides kroppenstedtii]|uniref:Restriction endonuclease n=2 Tax=Rhodococcoides kroppenstedtii TaxID=293050 RepID=A0A1I0UC63_9NOCA|nr:hypothetical protein SAMN05444374_11847 [Rhodococcus kroppenstedtii]